MLKLKKSEKLEDKRMRVQLELRLAIAGKDNEAIKLILENETDIDNNMVLWVASSEGHLELAKFDRKRSGY